MLRRRAVRGVLAVVVVLLLAFAVGAEEQPAEPKQPWRFGVLPDLWRLEIPESPAVHVGAITRDDEIARLTLREAIALAVENNPSIAAERLEPLRQSEGI